MHLMTVQKAVPGKASRIDLIKDYTGREQTIQDKF
jgi:hypothetical protein